MFKLVNSSLIDILIFKADLSSTTHANCQATNAGPKQKALALRKNVPHGQHQSAFHIPAQRSPSASLHPIPIDRSASPAMEPPSHDLTRKSWGALARSALPPSRTLLRSPLRLL